jgi:hypothetical protein
MHVIKAIFSHLFHFLRLRDKNFTNSLPMQHSDSHGKDGSYPCFYIGRNGRYIGSPKQRSLIPTDSDWIC